MAPLIWQLPILNQWKEKLKYVARPGIQPRTSDLRNRCPTDCAIQPGFLSVSHFCFLWSLYRGSISVPYINRSDLQTEETGLLPNCFYCFQSATVYSCFICFQIISGISGGCADWNISKFPKEDCVAGKGTSVNFLRRICVLILYILKLLFWSKNSVCFEPLHCFQTVVGYMFLVFQNSCPNWFPSCSTM